jgi:t-SNARE complex subunit (syntaxin)
MLAQMKRKKTFARAARKKKFPIFSVSIIVSVLEPGASI